jgi:hypothetical protein
LKRESVPKREALAIPAEKRVHVWVEDEPRYGLISVIRRYWTLKGHRPQVPYQTKFEWGYVYGALDVVTGPAAFVYTPTVSLPWTDASLKERIATDPEAMHIIIGDRAGFHPKEDSPELPASVRFWLMCSQCALRLMCKQCALTGQQYPSVGSDGA